MGAAARRGLPDLLDKSMTRGVKNMKKDLSQAVARDLFNVRALLGQLPVLGRLVGAGQTLCAMQFGTIRAGSAKLFCLLCCQLSMP